MKPRASFAGVVCLVAVVLVASAGMGISSSAAAPASSSRAPAICSPAAVPSLPAAQEEPGSISKAWRLKIKPGMEAQFEEALKQHWEVHRQSGDTSSYVMFMVEDGEHAGEYGLLTSGHHWADFDVFDAEISGACSADYVANLAQYVESMRSVITAGLPHVSRPPAPEDTFQFAQVYEYRVSFEGAAEWVHLLEKSQKAVEAVDWPLRFSWSTLVSGSEGPLFYCVVYMDNWADFAGPEMTFEAALEEYYGRQEAEEIVEDFYEAAESVTTWIARLRPDLSYVPGAQ